MIFEFPCRFTGRGKAFSCDQEGGLAGQVEHGLQVFEGQPDLSAVDGRYVAVEDAGDGDFEGVEGAVLVAPAQQQLIAFFYFDCPGHPFADEGRDLHVRAF